jgi:plasmid stability protein
MPGIFVRGLKAKTVKRLKDRAKRNGRSLQSEAKLLLEQSAGSEDVRAMLDRWKERFGKR